LQSYDRKTTTLKNLYQKDITEDAEEYNNYGWILSDHGPNFKNSSPTSLTSNQPLHLRPSLSLTILQIIHLFDPSPYLHLLSSTPLQTNHSFIWHQLTSIK
jgi:hypothetical protein